MFINTHTEERYKIFYSCVHILADLKQAIFQQSFSLESYKNF